MSETYALAPNAIFWSVQGEGSLAGEPMVFVRLAGCSVGCEQCDTDYRVASRMPAHDITRQVASLMTPATRWVWITGGEPTDRDLRPLLAALRRIPDLKVAVATSGHKMLCPPHCGLEIQHLSVSPHNLDAWVQRRGDDLKLIPGLNGLRLAGVESRLATDLANLHQWFTEYFVQPMWDNRKDAPDPDSLQQCLEWIRRHPNWRVSGQIHKQLRMA